MKRSVNSCEDLNTKKYFVCWERGLLLGGTNKGPGGKWGKKVGENCLKNVVKRLKIDLKCLVTE